MIHSRLYGLKSQVSFQEDAMKNLCSFPFCIVRSTILLLSASLPGVVHAADVGGAVSSRSAEVEGVKLHYLTAGHGPAVILLHGYTQTSLMWKPIIPLLAEQFTVIAPDLPGIGDSEIPADGLDMKTAAIRIHALAKSLGIEKARVVGHDIGLMVAYAYAAQFPAETEKLVVMDAFLPGVAGWENVYNNPGIWHFRFNGPTPEALVHGRERTYFEHFWNDFAADKTHSIPGCLRGGICTSRTNARGLGIFRLLPAGSQRLRGTLSDQADHAGPRGRRREGERSFARAANENCGVRRYGDRPRKYWTLGTRGTAEGNNRCANEISVTREVRKRLHSLVDDRRIDS